jgi:hypothetical protein
MLSIRKHRESAGGSEAAFVGERSSAPARAVVAATAPGVGTWRGAATSVKVALDNRRLSAQEISLSLNGRQVLN